MSLPVRVRKALVGVVAAGCCVAGSVVVGGGTAAAAPDPPTVPAAKPAAHVARADGYCNTFARVFKKPTRSSTVVDVCNVNQEVAIDFPTTGSFVTCHSGIQDGGWYGVEVNGGVFGYVSACWITRY